MQTHVYQQPMVNGISVVLKENLVPFSLAFFAYAWKLNPHPNIKFFMTKACHFTQNARRETTTIYKLGGGGEKKKIC